MRFFRSDIDTLRRSSSAKTTRRFVCCVIDLLLIAILAEAIFAGSFLITKSSAAYIAADSAIEDEIRYYETLTAETHIVEYVEGERVSTDVVVLKNLYRAICLSYQVFGNDQQPDFVFDTNHDVMINGIHSVENDNVAYFYTHYLAENTSMGNGVIKDIFEIYKNSFGDDATFMFSFNKELSEVPVLNTQVAYYLFHYLFIDSSDSIGQTGATYYRSYYQAYSNMLEDAEQIIIASEPYNSTHYLSYKTAYCSQARYTNITLVISILVSSLILLLIPRYLFKDGRTVGYRLLGLGVVRSDGQVDPWYMTLIKTVIDSVGIIPIAFILYMFPPFNGGYEAMFMPIDPDSRLSFAMVVLAIAIIGGINNAFGLFTPKKQNLINMIFGDVVVDVNCPDEDTDEINHGREY